MATSRQGEGTKSVVPDQALLMRLMVDKRKKRVVYAKCDRFMADALFSFLVTPVGALVRRTGKDSGLGCMDSLYKSVEDMDLHHFQTPACRELLLRPRSAFGFPHHRLKIAINDVEPKFYMCRHCNRPRISSSLPGIKCECGQDMTYLVALNFPCPRTSDVAFVRASLNSFVVTDDLFLAPSSDSLIHELCIVAGVEDSSAFLEERIVRIDNDNIVKLMKLSLHSNTPLTDTFLPSESVTKPINWPLEFLHQHLIIKKKNIYVGFMKKLGKDLERIFIHKSGKTKISITLFHDQKRVLFAKVDKDFIDLICSFLTFPLGSIVMAAGGRSSLGCLDNLHQVVKKLTKDGHLYAQKASKSGYGRLLLNPPVALHHNSQQLQIGSRPFPMYYSTCPTCSRGYGVDVWCSNNQHRHFEWKPINPKYDGKPTIKSGGGYIRQPETFVVTNDFVVKPTNGEVENNFASDLQKKTVIIGKKEALKLMMASLLSQDPFTNVFLEDNSFNY